VRGRAATATATAATPHALTRPRACVSAQRAAPTCACGGGGRETGHWSDWVGIRSCRRQASSATTTTSTTAVRAQGSRTSYAAVIATSTTASSAAAAAAPIAAAGACTDTATVTTAWQSGACVRRSRRRGALHARGGACPPERRWRARAGTLAPQTHTHTHVLTRGARAPAHQCPCCRGGLCTRMCGRRPTAHAPATRAVSAARDRDRGPGSWPLRHHRRPSSTHARVCAPCVSVYWPLRGRVSWRR